MTKPRVLAILSEYPQLSQTYKENELRSLLPHVELKIISYAEHDTFCRDHLPFLRCDDAGRIAQEAASFEPNIIHGHYLHLVPILHAAAELAGCRWSVRTHSFDVLGKSIDYLQRYRDMVNGQRCAGLLCFPFLKQRFAQAGYKPEKIRAAPPVVDVKRFLDTSPNGHGVVNTGACIPKKNMKEYVELARLVPEKHFSLVPIGYLSEDLQSYNQSQGSPVHFRDTVEPMEMPRIYKQHNWLVYTADRRVGTVGWPMAIAEAQASGLGILMQNIRPDLSTWIGPAGYLFNTLDEAAALLRQPYPEEMRQAGFDHAKKSDLHLHIRQLFSLWQN